MSCILLVLQNFNARFGFVLALRTGLVWWAGCSVVAGGSRFVLGCGLMDRLR